MRVRLIAVGTRMPVWVQSGFHDYARRLSGECRLELEEIRLGPRSKRDTTNRAVEIEGERMLHAIRPSEYVISLDVGGQSLSTEGLAKQLDRWMQAGRDVAILIGGPDGLSAECADRADFSWSLSALTLPHGLTRVVVAEQLYRAWSVLKGHPYHRG